MRYIRACSKAARPFEWKYSDVQRRIKPCQARGIRMSSESVSVFAKLKEHGLLLQTDANLPNVCALVAGAPVRGSWWAHPRSHEIFRVSCGLAEHPDVLVIKLVSSKVTYVHRALWPYVVTIGRARAAWQLESLSRAALELLEEVDGTPVQTARGFAKPASELKKFPGPLCALRPGELARAPASQFAELRPQRRCQQEPFECGPDLLAATRIGHQARITHYFRQRRNIRRKDRDTGRHRLPHGQTE